MPSRRTFLQLTGLSAASVTLGIAAPTAADATPARPIPDGAFALGVASGDPRPDGFVLWTRLAPTPLAVDGHGGMPAGEVPVQWEVAEDSRFRNVVRRGLAIASPDLAHAVHPEVRGLRPGREYFYRFRVGTQVSPVGRTKTLPTYGEQFTFATASCQAWYHGYFAAHRDIARRAPDAVFFLGDYIYEYGIVAGDNLWRAGVTVGPEHGVEIETLEQYRLRYSLFKTDPDLQAAHAVAPWFLVWDDHEVQNNYGAANSLYGVPPELFVHRRAVAYRAYYENAPLALGSLPQGPDGRIYRRYDIGSLARVHLLDTRQYRDPLPVDEADRVSEQRTIMGAEQEAWLYDGLRGSRAPWNIVAGGVVLSAVTDDRTEQWDGYPANRRRVLEAMGGAGTSVMLTGDIHRHVASELKLDFADPASRTVGVELVCSSVGSNGDGTDTDAYAKDWLQHPYMKLYNARRGYVHSTMTRSELTTEFVNFPYIQADTNAQPNVVARFRTPVADPRLEAL
ncbi:alkaline phosphatase D [Kribbella sp. VKM Ac-2569]|uniref:alkaline phosphatase D family protein n=1 Tax=Kribbella sp. VKM Ac-2569 TaxID=2512220 RepID=UPI0010D39060|nr:alkaline phosphatase D family protein [Kribbella sp. VKM Ac-2569]RZT15105.1 alkaline phosphatase D [Kribbella sp. VKM Ac-2569]